MIIVLPDRSCCFVTANRQALWCFCQSLLAPKPAKHAPELKPILSIPFSNPATHWTLDDESFKCEHGTRTALLIVQPSQKSLRQWCVSTSSPDESPWCLLTGLIPLVRKANQECSFAPKHMLQGRLHLAQMRQRKGKLKITKREGMADRQGRDEMKEHKHTGMLLLRQNSPTDWFGQTSSIDLFYFFWQNKVQIED